MLLSLRAQSTYRNRGGVPLSEQTLTPRTKGVMKDVLKRLDALGSKVYEQK